MDIERSCREDHTFFKVIIGDFIAKIGPRRPSEERHIGTHGLEWNEQGRCRSRKPEWDNMGMKIDGRQMHHLRFAEYIVLITPDISQAERMLADFDKACGKIGLRLNRNKTMFMKNGLVSFAPFTLNGTNISECSNYVYLCREINIMNDLAPELSRRKRAAWRAFKSIEDIMK
uniref:Reverse transcriptase domain-containing protein n=1 Tax=Angiostrongylus cantonensis TaxID=6313 RepID=A0A158P7X7_ANGCA